MADHPSLAELRQFMLGNATPQQTRVIVRHLAGDCSACLARLSSFRWPIFDGESPLAPPGAPDGSEYDAVLDAAEARCFAGKESQGAASPVLQAPARSGPAGPLDRMAPLRQIRAQIEKAFALRHSDPGRMAAEIERAWSSAQKLDSRTYGDGLVADYQGWVLAEMANSLRIRDELQAAWQRFKEARARLESGSGDPFLQAHVGEIEAALRADRRQLATALRVLDRSFRAYLKLGETHLAGRALLARAVHTDTAGDPVRALDLLKRATGLIDPGRDPRLATIAQQNYLNLLAQTGQYRAAAAYLLESGLRKKLEDQPLGLAKLRWVEGRVLRGLDRLDKAEVALEAARQTFRDHESRYNAALVGLDLAEVWSRQGRLEKVQVVASETLAVFEALRVKREARVAVQFLRATCHIQHAVPAVAQRVNRFLARLEVQPELVFEQFLAASGA